MRTFSSHFLTTAGILSALLSMSLPAVAQYRTVALPDHSTDRVTTNTYTLWWITQLGLGPAGEFEINNTNSTSAALIATTKGNGDGGDFYSFGSGDAGAFLAQGTGAGLASESINGAGVIGKSTYADGGDFYSFGSGNAATFIAQGSGDGVRSGSINGYGVYGESTNSSGGVFISYGSGDAGDFFAEGGGIGLYGYASSGAGIGVFGSSSGSSGIGVEGNGGLYAGYFAGNLAYTGTLSHVSDARLKQDIRTFPNALDTVLALRGVSFDWRRNEFPQMHFSKTRQIGFIAQEVEKVVPELVSKDRQGMRSLDYTQVVPILVEAIKQQQKQIEALKVQNKQLSDLKAQYATLASKLARLEQVQQANSRNGNVRSQYLAHK